MSVRTPSPSIFRPSGGIRQTALQENEALVRDINRRNLLRGTVSLGALSFLTGCDVKDSSAVRSMLLGVSAWNDRVQEFIFRPGHLAPTFSESQVLKPPRFNAYYPAYLRGRVGLYWPVVRREFPHFSRAYRC